jgi:hypothetical protein
MDQLKGLPLGRKLILGAGALLFIDTFLAWQSVSIGVPGVATVSASQNAWHGFWGVLLGLMTIVLLLWVGARAFGVALPAAVPDGLATLALGGLIALFAILKALTESYSAWPSYVGIILGIGVAVGAWLTFQESGESLPRVAAATAGAPAAGTPDASTDDAPAPTSGADAT